MLTTYLILTVNLAWGGGGALGQDPAPASSLGPPSCSDIYFWAVPTACQPWVFQLPFSRHPTLTLTRLSQSCAVHPSIVPRSLATSSSRRKAIEPRVWPPFILVLSHFGGRGLEDEEARDSGSNPHCASSLPWSTLK